MDIQEIGLREIVISQQSIEHAELDLYLQYMSDMEFCILKMTVKFSGIYFFAVVLNYLQFQYDLKMHSPGKLHQVEQNTSIRILTDFREHLFA